MHGGCYVLNPGEAGLPEAIFMAGFGHIKVISVDYRMPPEAVFPGALDDGITVWKAALKTVDAKNMAIFGTSAGGALTLEMVLKAKELGLPLPGDPLYDPASRDPREFYLEHVLLKYTDFDTRERSTLFLPDCEGRGALDPSIAALLAKLAAS